jgi:hypothetical protein
MKILFTISLFLSSCITIENEVAFINYEVMPYLNAYKEYKLLFLNRRELDYNISIIFKHLPNAAGSCFKNYLTGSRAITLDTVLWNKNDDNYRLQLLFHELGHCDLNLDHQEETPGIMNKAKYLKPMKHSHIEAFFTKGL